MSYLTKKEINTLVDCPIASFPAAWVDRLTKGHDNPALQYKLRQVAQHTQDVAVLLVCARYTLAAVNNLIKETARDIPKAGKALERGRQILWACDCVECVLPLYQDIEGRTVLRGALHALRHWGAGWGEHASRKKAGGKADKAVRNAMARARVPYRGTREHWIRHAIHGIRGKALAMVWARADMAYPFERGREDDATKDAHIAYRKYALARAIAYAALTDEQIRKSTRFRQQSLL